MDEADRLKMSSLEQMRALFDAGGIGLVPIGMPGLEKRLARYAHFYSRIGFVHEFRPLNTTEMQRLLSAHWTPKGVKYCEKIGRFPTEVDLRLERPGQSVPVPQCICPTRYCIREEGSRSGVLFWETGTQRHIRFIATRRTERTKGH